MDIKHALNVNARPWNHPERCVTEARAAILEHAAKCVRSHGAVKLCPLCGEVQPQQMPVDEVARKREVLRLNGIGGAWINPFGDVKKAA